MAGLLACCITSPQIEKRRTSRAPELRRSRGSALELAAGDHGEAHLPPVDTASECAVLRAPRRGAPNQASLNAIRAITKHNSLSDEAQRDGGPTIPGPAAC